MKPPKFWNNPAFRPGLMALALWPLSKLWAFKTHMRLSQGARETIGVPVIAVGNINLGGTGKTPTVIALIELLKSMGKNPAVISRGYGGKIDGPHQVNPLKDTADKTGDEPILIAGFAPVWVSKKRALGAKAAVTAGHDCIILDDALQNPDLHHDLTLTVVDAETGFGNGMVCPSGPLREPINMGLSRTDFIISIGDTDAQSTLSRTWPKTNKIAKIAAQLRPLPTGFSWKGMRAYAFAGIGRPKKFFDALRSEGAEIIVARPFGDHEPYSIAVLKRMQAEAWTKDANLVTTEKDAARLPNDMRAEVLTFPVRLQFEDTELISAKISVLFQ